MGREALKTSEVVLFRRGAIEYSEPVLPNRETALGALWKRFGSEPTTAGKQAVWDRIAQVRSTSKE